jgi:hypothetical protein
MLIRKILTGTALASIIAIAVPAYALTLTIPAASVKKLANEVSFTSGVTGSIAQLTVTTATPLPQANGYKLTINLTGGNVTFNNLTAAAVSAAAGLGGTIVSTGGSNTDSQVVILFNTTTSAVGTGANVIKLDIPIKMSSCASSVGVNVVLTDPSNNVIEGGAASLVLADGLNAGAATAAVTCGSAFSLTFAADPNVTKLSTASNYKLFKVAGPDTTTVAELGDITLAIDTSFVKNGLATAVSAADITKLDWQVLLENTTGITAMAATVGAVPAVSKSTTSGSLLYTFSEASAVAGASKLTATVSGTPVVSPQDVKIQNASIDFVSGFVDEPATVTLNGAESLSYEGQNFGPFRWVGDGTKSSVNVFRVTGLKSKPAASVVIKNSTTGVDGTYALNLSGIALNGNAAAGATELVIYPTDIQAAVGSAFGRADVTFVFNSGVENVIDVDRLISVNGVVSSYGDNNNNNPPT